MSELANAKFGIIWYLPLFAFLFVFFFGIYQRHHNSSYGLAILTAHTRNDKSGWRVEERTASVPTAKPIPSQKQTRVGLLFVDEKKKKPEKVLAF